MIASLSFPKEEIFQTINLPLIIALAALKFCAVNFRHIYFFRLLYLNIRFCFVLNQFSYLTAL